MTPSDARAYASLNVSLPRLPTELAISSPAFSHTCFSLA